MVPLKQNTLAGLLYIDFCVKQKRNTVTPNLDQTGDVSGIAHIDSYSYPHFDSDIKA